MTAIARRPPARRRSLSRFAATLAATLATTSTALLAVAVLAGPAPARRLPPGVVYAMPVPGAALVHVETPLLLRFDHALDADEARRVSLSVTGSASGPHPGTTTLTAGGRLIRFVPRLPFAYGERVTVTLAAPWAAAADPAACTYAFDLAATPPAPVPALDDDPPAGRHRAPAATGGAPALTATGNLTPPAITTTVTGACAPGLLFLAPFPLAPTGQSWLLVTDDRGNPIWSRPMPATVYDFKLHPNGLLSYYDGGAMKEYVMDTTFAVVDSFDCVNGYQADVHDFQWLPDGHVLLMSYDSQYVDMSQIVEGGNPNAQVIGLELQELDENRQLVFEWRSWDHFQITDANGVDFTAPVIDYVHGNAIELDTDGNLLLSSRHLDEITKIDRTSGDVIWRWGGKYNVFLFLEGAIPFSHQHAIRRIANGHLTLFDNGNLHPLLPYSRALEYDLDEVNMTATQVWEYHATPAIFGAAMGYVQRLDNGNTLIGWGTGKPDVIEVNSLGHPVLTLSLPAGMTNYRAYRFPWTAGLASAPASRPLVAMLSPVSPNPFVRETDLSLALAAPARVSLAVYDVMGREVRTILDRVPLPAGVWREHVDLSSQPAGLYFCRVTAGNRVETRTLVLRR